MTINPLPHLAAVPPRLVALAATLVAALSLALVAAVPASAHVTFSGAEPPANSIVATAPAQVIVQFSGEVAESGSTLTVTGPDGTAADNGDGHLNLDDLDRRTIVATLRSGLPDGLYTVNYTGYPADGHEPNIGSYTFTVGAALDTATPADATPAATPASTPVATPIAIGGSAEASTNGSGSNMTAILLLVVGAVVVVLGGGAAVVRAMRRG